ncbi:hypothetical protein [Gorillibacterium sp. sgz500922]|uniref:hypothetical protein n=1 Tax=Gorillibacterium sp. sgz500922 TaxID=3446694 RepID=UPI003F66260E
MRYTIRVTKLVLFCLMLTLLLVGCRSEDNPDTLGNLYEEKEIPVDSFVHSLYSVKPDKAVSGRFLLALYNEEVRTFQLAYADASFAKLDYVENDLHSITDYRNVLEQPKAEYGVGDHPIFDTDPQGSIYLLEYRIERGDQPLMNSRFVFIYDKTGHFKDRMPVKGTSALQNFTPFKLEVSKDKMILVGNNGIQILDLGGSLLSEVRLGSTKALNAHRGEELTLPSGTIVDAVWMDNGTLAVLQQSSGGGATLSAYRLDLKQTSWSTSLPEGFFIRGVFYDSAARILYAGSPDRILSHDTSGGFVEETIRFDSYQSGSYTAAFLQGDETLELGPFFLTGNKEWKAFFRTTQAPRLISKGYSYRQLTGKERTQRLAAIESEEKEKKVLQVLVPFPDNAIKQKVAAYEKQHRDIKVELSYFRESDQDFNTEDYKQFISLQLFTGKRKWDLMATQFLPYKNYLDKDLFADVVEAAPSLWEREKQAFLPNIVKAITRGGKVSIIPSRISMITVMADRTAAESLSPTNYKWADLARLGQEFKTRNPAVKLWYMNAKRKDSFVNRYQMTIDGFSQDMLDTREKENQTALISQFLDVIKTTGREGDYADPPQDKPLFIVDYFFMQDFLINLDLYTDGKVLLGEPAMERSGRHSFLIQEGYAVNKTSDRQQEAFELAFFLSRYGEQNNIIRQDTYENLLKMEGMTPEKEAAIMEVRNITGSLDTLNYLDHRVTDAILYTAEQYDSGMIDKDAAIQTIQEKLWLYLHE